MSQLRLGLRENLPQFALLVGVNALVGGMLGQERTVLPLLAQQEFGLERYSAALTYIVAFGLAKAATNYFAGTWSDRFGRKPVLVAGWLVAVPVPVLLIVAPSWAVVVAANVLLGVSQGLTWSTTVIMKIDLVGPRRRGLAMGFNESAGYVAVAATALATGYLAEAHGLRPAPFLLGLAFPGVGLGLSGLIVAGMLTQAGGLALVAAAGSFAWWALASVLLGAGTAMVYPALLAAVGDVAHPAWRARAVGVYRLWRDTGFAVGALLAGITADALGLRAAIWIVAALTAASGLVVTLRMYETLPRANQQDGRG